jgi:20S proteasome subunit alpha 6
MKVSQIVCAASILHRVHDIEVVAGNLEDLIRHGLHALRETLQQDKELNVNNTSVGIIGPMGQHEKPISPPGSFRILEGDKVEVYLESMEKKEEAPAPAPASVPDAAPAPTADEDVQMSG